MKMKTNIIYPAFALFAVAYLAVSPSALAVIPAPDGGYPNFNTAEGEDALFSLRTGATGIRNTASGIRAFFNLSSGDSNIAVGDFAGLALTSGSNNIYIGNGGGAATESSTIRIGTQGTQTKTFVAGV